MLIITSIACNCGRNVALTFNGREWIANCPDCYAPGEDSGASECVVGRGTTADEALWAWQDAFEDAVELMIWPHDLLTQHEPHCLEAQLERAVAEEVERQRALGFRSSPLSVGPVKAIVYANAS